MQYLADEDEEDDATPVSLAEDFDANEDAKAFLAGLPTLDPAQYDLRRLHHALQNDVDILTNVGISSRHSPKQMPSWRGSRNHSAAAARQEGFAIHVLQGHGALSLPRAGTGAGAAWRKSAGSPHIRRMDSGASPIEREP